MKLWNKWVMAKELRDLHFTLYGKDDRYLDINVKLQALGKNPKLEDIRKLVVNRYAGEFTLVCNECGAKGDDLECIELMDNIPDGEGDLLHICLKCMVKALEMLDS